MSLMSRAPRAGAGSAAQHDAVSSPGIGKRTLVQQLEAAAQAPATAIPAPSPLAATQPAGGGQPLPDDLRARMERAFGADFSRVRVIESPEAATMGALAYTRGTDIFVAPGHDPTSAQGQELLGHELAHVVQQAQGRAAATSRSAVNADPALEQEADELGSRAARGESARSDAGPGGGHSATPAIQYKLRRTHGIPGQDRDLEHGEIVPIGTYLRDNQTNDVYRYVSAYPDASAVILRGVTANGAFVYSFANETVQAYDLQQHERALGRDINQKMEQVNDALGEDPDHGVHYEHTYQQQFPNAWRDDYVGGYADPGRFERTAPMTWRLRANRSASAAIHAWLDGLTIAECGTVLVAIQLRELLQVVGADKFDEMFGSAQPFTNPSVQRLTIDSDLSECIPQALIKGAGTTPQNGPALKLGAKYYFQNHSAYLRKHPDGALQGENSVYMGHQQQEHYFAGFGIGPVTLPQMCNKLRQGYNAQRTEADYRILVTHLSKVPQDEVARALESGWTYRRIYEASVELMHPDYRIGDQLPDQLSMQQWLADPASGIQGQGVMLDTLALLDVLTQGM